MFTTLPCNLILTKTLEKIYLIVNTENKFEILQKQIHMCLNIIRSILYYSKVTKMTGKIVQVKIMMMSVENLNIRKTKRKGKNSYR
jgi:hypothetical protein